MPDSNVYTIDAMSDLDGRKMPVGVDYDAVTIGDYRFPLAAVPMLKAVIDTAAIRAASKQADMDEEDRCLS
jgi:hypothetical protein